MRVLLGLAAVLALAAHAFADDLFGPVPENVQKRWTTLSIEKMASDRGLGVDDVRKVIEENFEKTYITAGSGIRLGSDQTSKDMMYEGQIFLNLSWVKPRDEPPGLKQWLDIPIRIGVRQFRGNSSPVMTPSYNPGLRWYLWSKEPGDKALHYYSIGAFHYSNGQDGPSTLADGSVNTQNGSFSTNYFEFTAYTASTKLKIQWLAVELRQHLVGLQSEFLKDQYELGHLALKARSDEFLLFAQPSQLGVSGAYGYGRKYVIKNDVDPSRNVEAKARDNLSATAELNIRPRSWKDVAFYLRYDIGYDYYNINFQNRMNRIQLGVSSTNF